MQNKLIVKEKSARVDLLGGTIDIWPLNIIIPKVVTLNLATSLKVKVQLETIDYKGIEINAQDYNLSMKIPSNDLNEQNIYIDRKFNNLTFIIQILDYFKIKKHLKITTSSSIPAGSGLGGSSALGIALFSALIDYQSESESESASVATTPLKKSKKECIKIVQDIEANALDMGPTGYQDYFPALYGGVLALMPTPGNIEVEQLFTVELKQYIENNFSLIYSGATRYSALNNWQVFKNFFDKRDHIDTSTKTLLQKIASYSYEGFLAIKKDKDYDKFKHAVIREGEIRKELCPNILTSPMMELLQKIKKEQNKQNDIGIKVCGAGGGGCFLLIHQANDRQLIDEKIKDFSMQRLKLEIMEPIF
ncbi:MAG: hypothetical protein HQK51_03905 [Oligoflexia bacterium]|nr:hypothetical protein [Oligoflexia bacterium]